MTVCLIESLMLHMDSALNACGMHSPVPEQHQASSARARDSCLVCHDELASRTCLLGPPAGKPPLSPLHLLAQPFLVLPIRHSEYRVPNLFVLRMCTCLKWLVARGPYKVEIQSSRCQLLIVVGAKWLPNMVWCVRCTSDCVSTRWLLRSRPPTTP